MANPPESNTRTLQEKDPKLLERTEGAVLVKENEASDSQVEAKNSDPSQSSQPPDSTADEAELDSEELEDTAHDDEPQPPDYKGRGPISYNSSGRPKPSKPSKPR
ncbi:hypothetical protein L218DRAFT_953297 [Marasmius fiardii PR-910]|nr:hypothetical protein L218DRAFT_953297 [Marasmius fiardii PR-910]